MIRLYRATDRAACHYVFFRAVREGAARVYSDAQRAVWASAPEPDDTQDDKLLSQFCVVAERDGRVVGFMSIRPDGYLDMAFVMPEEMGKGTAGLLYDALVTRAREAAILRLTVHASVFSRQFLARRGWHLDKVIDVEKGGQIFQSSCMSVELTPIKA